MPPQSGRATPSEAAGWGLSGSLPFSWRTSRFTPPPGHLRTPGRGPQVRAGMQGQGQHGKGDYDPDTNPRQVREELGAIGTCVHITPPTRTHAHTHTHTPPAHRLWGRSSPAWMPPSTLSFPLLDGLGQREQRGQDPSLRCRPRPEATLPGQERGRGPGGRGPSSASLCRLQPTREGGGNAAPTRDAWGCAGWGPHLRRPGPAWVA